MKSQVCFVLSKTGLQHAPTEVDGDYKMTTKTKKDKMAPYCSSMEIQVFKRH